MPGEKRHDNTVTVAEPDRTDVIVQIILVSVYSVSLKKETQV